VPELPEVETIRRQLAPAVTGRRIESAGGHPSPKFAAAADSAGPTVTGVGRRGKYLLIGLDDNRELVIHLGMTGALRLRTTGAGGDPYVRAWWALDDGSVLELRDLRRFGRVAVVPAGQHASLPTLAGLGPEPLSDDFTAAGLYTALRLSEVRVKTQLLHQRVVAGIGNIYADEALWRAGVNPAARRVGRDRAAALHAAIRHVLAAGIANGGTTLRDYRTMTGGEGRNQFALACYGRAGHPCGRCGRPLRRRMMDGRGTTSCPSCQRG
jgi:formamidopyrimidine-DNA glycosylase